MMQRENKKQNELTIQKKKIQNRGQLVDYY